MGETMTVERRREHTEVVTRDDGDFQLVDVPKLTPIPRAQAQSETQSGDLYANQRTWVRKLHQAIYLLFGVLVGLLGVRFLLGLLGANPAAGFAQFIYGITAPFIVPFIGLFGEQRFEGVVFDWNVLVAILVYAVLAGILVKVVSLVMDNTRRGTYTTTSSHVDRA